LSFLKIIAAVFLEEGYSLNRQGERASGSFAVPMHGDCRISGYPFFPARQVFTAE
jgi:hypothetical protein